MGDHRKLQTKHPNAPANALGPARVQCLERGLWLRVYRPRLWRVVEQYTERKPGCLALIPEICGTNRCQWARIRGLALESGRSIRSGQ